jgi:hypothetical protein
MFSPWIIRCHFLRALLIKHRVALAPFFPIGVSGFLAFHVVLNRARTVLAYATALKILLARQYRLAAPRAAMQLAGHMDFVIADCGPTHSTPLDVFNVMANTSGIAHPLRSRLHARKTDSPQPCHARKGLSLLPSHGPVAVVVHSIGSSAIARA